MSRPPDPGRRQLYVEIDGVNVRLPYVAMWSSEAGARVSIHRDLGPMVVASGQRGWGAPVPGQMDFHRQREVVARGWCQVCADTLKPGPRWLLPVDITPAPYESDAGTIEDTVRTSRPWTCRRCTAELLAAIPELLFVIKARTWHTDLGVIDARPLVPEERRTFEGEVVDEAIGYASIVPLEFAVVERADFLDRWAKITARRSR